MFTILLLDFFLCIFFLLKFLFHAHFLTFCYLCSLSKTYSHLLRWKKWINTTKAQQSWFWICIVTASKFKIVALCKSLGFFFFLLYSFWLFGVMQIFLGLWCERLWERKSLQQHAYCTCTPTLNFSAVERFISRRGTCVRHSGRFRLFSCCSCSSLRFWFRLHYFSSNYIFFILVWSLVGRGYNLIHLDVSIMKGSKKNILSCGINTLICLIMKKLFLARTLPTIHFKELVNDGS